MTSKTLAGLEAIKFMEQGGIIIEKDAEDSCILKIEEGLIWIKSPAIEGYWTVEPCFDFSVAYEEYIEPKYIIGWKRVEAKESYFALSGEGVVCISSEDNHKIDDVRYNIANYFSTEEKAEEINFKQTLFRKLQRFSDENGGTEIDLNCECHKFCIEYCSIGKLLVSNRFSSTTREFGQVYFSSREVAQQAIDLFHDDLIKYFTM